MPEIERQRVLQLVAKASSDDKALKGDALEQLVVHLFEAIPGCDVRRHEGGLMRSARTRLTSSSATTRSGTGSRVYRTY